MSQLEHSQQYVRHSESSKHQDSSEHPPQWDPSCSREWNRQHKHEWELDQEELRKHRPEDVITYVRDFDYMLKVKENMLKCKLSLERNQEERLYLEKEIDHNRDLFDLENVLKARYMCSVYEEKKWTPGRPLVDRDEIIHHGIAGLMLGWVWRYCRV